MPGKFCAGATRNNSYFPKDSKAFSEGIYHRAKGTAVAYPITDCPHASGGAFTAWRSGWVFANAATGTTVNQANAPCVAVPTNTILA